LLPLAARFGPPDRRFLAVEALRTKSQQRTRPLDGLQRALLQGLHGRAERSPALIEIPLPFVGLLLALAEHGFTPVGFALALAGRTLALVSQGLALVSRTLTLVSQAVTFVGLELAFVGRTLPVVSHGRPFAGLALALVGRTLALVSQALAPC
jgi:hypothetical protein